MRPAIARGRHVLHEHRGIGRLIQVLLPSLPMQPFRITESGDGAAVIQSSKPSISTLKRSAIAGFLSRFQHKRLSAWQTASMTTNKFAGALPHASESTISAPYRARRR
jgi:hypothetical protein